MGEKSPICDFYHTCKAVKKGKIAYGIALAFPLVMARETEGTAVGKGGNADAQARRAFASLCAMDADADWSLSVEHGIATLTTGDVVTTGPVWTLLAEVG